MLRARKEEQRWEIEKLTGSFTVTRPGETHFLGTESASSPYQKAISDGFSERFASDNRFYYVQGTRSENVREYLAFHRDREYKTGISSTLYGLVPFPRIVTAFVPFRFTHSAAISADDVSLIVYGSDADDFRRPAFMFVP